MQEKWSGQLGPAGSQRAVQAWRELQHWSMTACTYSLVCLIASTILYVSRDNGEARAST